MSSAFHLEFAIAAIGKRISKLKTIKNHQGKSNELPKIMQRKIHHRAMTNESVNRMSMCTLYVVVLVITVLFAITATQYSNQNQITH